MVVSETSAKMSVDFIRFSAIFVILLQLGRATSVPLGEADSQQNPEAIRNEKSLEMLKYMNPAANPCQNFYEFACGSWPKYHKATPMKRGTNIFEEVSENHRQQTKMLLATDDMEDTNIDKLVKNLYRSCMHLPAMWNAYLRNLKAIVDEFGQMPVLAGSEWRESEFDWVKTVGAILYRYSIPIIVAAAPKPDLFNTSVRCLIVTSGSFELETKAAYIDDALVDHRSKYKGRVACNLHTYLSIDTRLAARTAKEIVDLEIALARGKADERLGLRPDKVFTNTSVKTMQRTYAATFDVERLINISWGTIPSLSYYEDSAYLQNLVDVMQKTPKKTVANYVFYQLLKDFFYKNVNLDYKEALKDHCLDKVEVDFTPNIETIAYRKFVTNQNEEDLNHMWHNIKVSFQDTIQSSRLRWVHEKTRNYAVEKLNAMAIEITGKHPKDLGPGVDRIVLDERDFLENMKTLKNVRSELNRDSLQKPPEQAFGPISSFTPMNIQNENKVFVPVSIIQGSYFMCPAVPYAFNFARMGTLLSHELVHGFDDTGRLHDKSGNLREWWDANSVNTFNNRTKCFVHQNKNYIFGGQHLAEREEQGENIADNGGLRVAYHAYLKWYQDKSRTREELSRETYPRLRYSSKQLFFIHYAQTWCTDIEESYKPVLVATHGHTPPEFRIIGTLSNLEEFSKEFSCPAGSPMNPLNKCDIY